MNRNYTLEGTGISQYERLNDTPLARCDIFNHYTLSNYLITMYAYSDILKFPGTKSNKWAKFLMSDNIMIYTLILNVLDDDFYNDVQKCFLEFKRASDLNSSRRWILQLFNFISDLLTVTLYWYEHLSDGFVKNEISNFFEKVTPKIQIITTIMTSLYNEDKDKNWKNFIDFTTDYIHKISPSTSLINETYVDTTANIYTDIRIFTRDLLETIISNITNLQLVVKKVWDLELYNGKHNPQITLMITFYHILNKYVNKHLMDIPKRYLEYYYKGVLGVKKYPKKQDNTWIMCKLGANSTNKILPKGTKLSAGQDNNGDNILFQTSDDIYLTHTRIRQIHTVELSKLKISNITKLPEMDMKIATYDMDEVYNNNENLYIFSKKYSKAQHIQNIHSDFPLGLMFISKIFELKDGDRTIELEFNILESSFKNFLNRTKQYDPLYRGEEETLKLAVLLFKHAIKIQYTTSDGWVTINHDNIEVDSQKRCVIIKLNIPNDAPEVSTLQTANINGIENPAIRFICDSDVLLGCALFVFELQFESLTINVDVKHYKKLILQNELGPIMNSDSFQPFGPFPKIGSPFYIGSPEIFSKPLKSLSVNIEWDNFPNNMYNGFKQIYKSYNNAIDASSFVVNAYLLQNFLWTPINSQPINLFKFIHNTDKTFEQVLPYVIFENLIPVNVKHFVCNHDLEPYTQNTQSGFIKLELAGPDMAFGHSTYYKLLADSMILKNKYIKKIFNRDLCEPYTPTIKNIYVNYKASQDYRFANISNRTDVDLDIVKLHVFGFEHDLFQNGYLQLFTDIQAAYGMLYMGLSDIDGDEVSLYIKIDEVSVNDENYIPPKWVYINGNTTTLFPEKLITFDSTLGFRQSGIVKIKIPSEIKKTTLFNREYKWLGIIFLDTTKYIPTIIGIYTNPVSATRISNNKDNIQIKPFSIQSIIDVKHQDVFVCQPFFSRNGKLEETDNEFYPRVSERLHHRNRIMSAWDYEHMILEHFQEINIVKCIDNADFLQNNFNKSGSVTIVVVMKTDTLENNRLFPQASSALLYQIKQYVQQYTSPFVNIHVINPVYVKIKISCEVKLDGNNKNYLIEEINNSIATYISPWLYGDTSSSIKIGQSIKAIDIINLISSKQYVLFLRNFNIFVYKDFRVVEVIDQNGTVEARTPYTTFYTSKVQSIMINNEEYSGHTIDEGLGKVSINRDFIVGPFSYINNSKKEVDDEKPTTLQTSVDDYYLYINL